MALGQDNKPFEERPHVIISQLVEYFSRQINKKGRKLQFIYSLQNPITFAPSDLDSDWYLLIPKPVKHRALLLLHPTMYKNKLQTKH